MPDWFLAYTKPRYEDSVEHRLKGAGFEVLNPRIKERKYYRRKITDIISPLFPCYIFVRFEREKYHHLIRYTRGIRRILTNETGPAPVPEDVVDSIIRRMEGGFITVKARFEPGEAVKLKDGPFEGFEAVFEREMKGIERVSILLRAINIRVVVDGRLLSRI